MLNIIVKFGDGMLMSILMFLRKHIDVAIRITAALALCALTVAFIFAFKGDKLPHASDGDAFDTIYALQQSADEETETD